MNVARNFVGAVQDDWEMYSDTSSDYTIGPPIGFGASSIVYTAVYHPKPSAHTPEPAPIPCALKMVDMDRLPPHALELLTQETQLMSLSKHPNVLRVRGTWTDGHRLYIALRLMNSGSAADVMRYAWSGGMEEEVVKCILKQALEGINYLHVNGMIHRDIKAANLLIDDDGTVLLGDLGVAAPLWDASAPGPAAPRASASASAPAKHGPHIHIHLPHFSTDAGHAHAPAHAHRPLGKRRSFVGTPCWMAPEVVLRQQYDASADVWSFGITALELATGRAPFAHAPPAAVLAHIVSGPAPALQREGAVHKYSAAFAEMVAACLARDPAARPSAEALLDSALFRSAKKKTYLVGTVLAALPPLVQRQERRRMPSVVTHATMESWDFATEAGSLGRGAGVGSATTSVRSYHSHQSAGAGQPVRRKASVASDDDVHEGGKDNERHEEDAATYARRIRARRRSAASLAPSRPHSHHHPRSDIIQEVDLSSSPQAAPAPQRTASAPAPRVPAARAPVAPASSRSPPASVRSRASLSPSTTDQSDLEPATPSSSFAPPPARLWRKLVGRAREKKGLEARAPDPSIGAGAVDDGPRTFRRTMSRFAGRIAGEGSVRATT